MAQALPCKYHETTPATFMFTNLDDGSTEVLCVKCATSFMATMLEAITSTPVQAMIDLATEQIAEAHDTEAEVEADHDDEETMGDVEPEVTESTDDPDDDPDAA